ncbi:glycoside hydrolase family 78 protein [Opitutus terrae]|uniref:glycoside hydrolase family 78 protein n=1 Tax=Opitutus terrae TaxID=107709 RepID=UPI00192AA909|nr:glycoside hydrolase family 78 protein [Opitutus terrae]
MSSSTPSSLSAAAAATPRHTTAALTTEYQTDPVGIDVARPRLSWQLRSDARGLTQAAYQIQVALGMDALARGDLFWDSGKIASDQSVQVDYAGPVLSSSQRYIWRVRTWNRSGEASDWSAPAFWEMGLLRPSDWSAAWITPAWDEDTSKSNPAPLLRKEFAVEGEIRDARLYVTSLGLYEAELNGQRVGDAVLTPGWTSYDHRLVYQTYDVTSQLKSGANALGVTLGNGWYRGPLTWDLERNTYGDRVALLAQLRITYADGRIQTIASDASWKASTGPILLSEIYAGECYDARLKKSGWSQPGYDDRDWSAVRVLDHRKDILVAPLSPPMRRIEEIKPVAILHTPAGETVIDFGQNMVGWVRLKVHGPAGTTVTLRHAEVLDKAGNFYTANLRHAAQQIDYTLSGRGDETFEPHFTFQGFRYVAVQGWPGEPSLESFTGIVVHSDLPRTGHWESSNARLNQLQHNILWGQKGNFVDVPTDCPQRDERLGWTGDAQVFARTAAFNLNVVGFFTKWLRDVAADQKPSGAVPFVIPDVLSRNKETEGSSGWSDVATIAPWTLYLVYGDRRALETQYPSMKAWVEFIRTRAKGDLWTTGWHFGDWLSYATTSPDYPGATTGKDLIASAFYAHSADLLSKAATVLGKADDARTYTELFERIKVAFNREFVTPSGRVGEATQTAYVLALQFDLLPEDKRPEAARRLAADVKRFGNHLTTGFLGTPYLCRVLSDHGQLDTAYALLNQDTYPSWLYPVSQGATTIWERWDGIKPDGTFQDAGMNSFNHYAYGAIGDWMYSVVAGIDIDPAAPGYKHLLIQPRPGGGLTDVRARLETQYGQVASAWKLADGHLELVVEIPPNTRATIRLPGAARMKDVRESGQPLARAAGITQVSRRDDAVIVAAGSGEYRFTYPLRR